MVESMKLLTNYARKSKKKEQDLFLLLLLRLLLLFLFSFDVFMYLFPAAHFRDNGINYSPFSARKRGIDLFPPLFISNVRNISPIITPVLEIHQIPSFFVIFFDPIH